jgi:hypothetical protein
MPQEKVFGRRASPARAIAPVVAPAAAPVRDLPTLKDLGFTPADDSAELRSFKQAFRYRRFVRLGGWRWIGGLCFSFGTICSLAGFGWATVLLGPAGIVCIILGFRRAKPRDPSAATAAGPDVPRP